MKIWSKERTEAAKDDEPILTSSRGRIGNGAKAVLLFTFKVKFSSQARVDVSGECVALQFRIRRQTLGEWAAAGGRAKGEINAGPGLGARREELIFDGEECHIPFQQT